MLFSASILSGFFLNTFIGRYGLFASANKGIKKHWCIPIICCSAVILPYFYNHAPFFFYALHTLLCFGTLQIVKNFCTPTAPCVQADPKDIKTILEKLCICYLDFSAVPILSMLIGGAPLMMLTTFIHSVSSSDGRIKQIIRYIPARLGAFFLLIVCGLLGYDVNNGRRIYQRDRKQYSIPEAGQILSVYAGALHLCFPAQGPSSIGNINRPVTSADIPTMKHICLFSSWFMLLVGCFIRLTFLI